MPDPKTTTETNISTNQSVRVFSRVFVATAITVAGLAITAVLSIKFIDDGGSGGGSGSGGSPAPQGATITITTLALASNGDHTIASINGELWAWGKNNNGQIGDGTVSYTINPSGLAYPSYTYNNDRFYPVRVLASTGLVFSNVAVGDHSLALQNNGAVWAWGPNQYRELGIATASPCGTAVICSMPQPVDNWEGGTAPTIIQVATGVHHSVAVDTLGKVWTWGLNNVGQLGYPTATPCPSDAAQVCGLTAKMIPNFPPTGRKIIAVSSSGYANLALDDAGTAYGWGLNNGAQLGLGDSNNRAIPTAIPAPLPTGIKKIALGEGFGMAVDASNALWTWGVDHLGFDCASCNPKVPNPVTDLTSVSDIKAGITQGLVKGTNNLLTVLDGNSHAADPDFGQVTSFAAGFKTLFAVRSADQLLYAKGDNENGTLGIPVLAANDQNLSPTTSYGYKVRAIDAFRNNSVFTNTIPGATQSNSDIVDPSTPPGFQATTNSLAVFLAWGASIDPPGGSGVVEYEIYRDGGTVPIKRITVYLRDYQDYDVVPSHTYSYTILAVDNAGNRSALSTPPLSARTADPSETVLPTTPTNLQAPLVYANRVDVSWTASTDASEIRGYEVYRNGTLLTSSAQLSNGTLYSDDAVIPGTANAYTIKAVDQVGNRSVASAPLNVTTPASLDLAAPTMPANLQVVANSSNQMSLSWDASLDNDAIIGYDVWRNGVRIDVAYLSFNGLTSILAPRALRVDTLSAPEGISLTNTTYQQNQVSLAWTVPVDRLGLTDYRVYRRLSGTASFTQIGTVSAALTTYVDTTVNQAKTYDYQISAVSTLQGGNSLEHSQSKIKSVTTKKK